MWSTFPPIARKEHVDKETGKIIPPHPYCDKCTAEIVCKAVKGK